MAGEAWDAIIAEMLGKPEDAAHEVARRVVNELREEQDGPFTGLSDDEFKLVIQWVAWMINATDDKPVLPVTFMDREEELSLAVFAELETHFRGSGLPDEIARRMDQEPNFE